MINKKIMTSLLAGALLLPACASVPKTASEKLSPKDNVKIIFDSMNKMASSDRGSVGATIGVGREFLVSYSNQLDKAQKIRKGFNLGIIGTGLYTAIAAGTGAHLHNIVISTAIGGALPLIEPNVQPEGSPETLGGAMVKTNCIIRAASLTQNADNLKAFTYVKKFKDNMAIGPAMRTKLNTAYTSYNGLIPIIISAYMQVYIDQANSATPALLEADNVVAQMTIKPTEENTAQAATDTEVETGVKSLNIAGLMGTSSVGLGNSEFDDYIERITTTANLVSDAVGKCIASS